MPTHLLLPLIATAGVVAIVLLWPRIQGGPSAPRLVIELVITMLALFALTWVLMMAALRLTW